MNVTDVLNQLISETPKYMTHITVPKHILEDLLKELEDLKKRIINLEKPQ